MSQDKSANKKPSSFQSSLKELYAKYPELRPATNWRNNLIRDLDNYVADVKKQRASR